MKVYEFLMIVDKTKDIVLMEEYNSSALTTKSYCEGFMEEANKIMNRTVTQISFNGDENEFVVTYQSLRTENLHKQNISRLHGLLYKESDSIKIEGEKDVKEN